MCKCKVMYKSETVGPDPEQEAKRLWIERAVADIDNRFVQFRLGKLMAGNPTDGDENVPRAWAEEVLRITGRGAVG